MLALSFCRSNPQRLCNLNKCIYFKFNESILVKGVPFSSICDKKLSKLNRNETLDSKSLLIKSSSPSLDSRRFVSIPPKNKQELNEVLDAFKSELSKFSVAELKKSPKTHLIYGAGGLAPFVLPSLQMLMFGYTDGMAWFQLAYGATILSYLGGIQWGATLPDGSKDIPSFETMGLAVAPQLLAWVGLLLPVPLGIITTCTSLTATLAVDLLKQNYPPWFKSLRIFLTTGAVISLGGTLFGYIVS